MVGVRMCHYKRPYATIRLGLKKKLYLVSSTMKPSVKAMSLPLLIVFAAAAALLVWRFAHLRLALRRARQGEARLRLVADHSEEMSWSIDCATLQLVYASPAFERRFGHGSLQRQLVLGQLLHDLPQRLAGGAEGRRRQLCQFDLAREDGGVVPFEVSSTVLADAHGHPTELLGVLRDVSAERAREQQWEQQCQRFASMLSHEFRNPLATIDGAIQNLEGGNGSGHAGANFGQPADEDTRKRYRKIAVAVERLLALLDDYLTPERMASIGRARQPNEIAPREFLEGAAARAVLNGHRITLHLSGLPATLRCDPEGMRLCLQVLLDNAVKHTPAGTHIVLSGGPALQGGIEILVSDDGPGVVEEDLPRLFEKAYRGRGATGGSGLGLYMARAVLDEHGGTLSVQNRPEGGAVFRIWLPGVFGAGKSLAPGACSSDNSTTQSKSELV